MKYRLLKDLLWLKAGKIIEINPVSGLYGYIIKNPVLGSESIFVCPKKYPDFFEPISEEDEKLEEAKKLLESKGYRLVKNHIHQIGNVGVIYQGAQIRCMICDDLIIM